jgi:putative endopeptidase
MNAAPSLLIPNRASRKRTKWVAMTLALLATATLWEIAPAESSPMLESGLDLNVKPGDDFYAFANGDWLKKTQIPQGKGIWADRNDFVLLIYSRVAQLAEQASGSPSGSYQRKVADFYAAYLDEPAIEARGLTVVKPQLKRVDQVRNKTELAALLGSGLRIDADPLNFGVFQSPWLFGLAVQPGMHGETAPFAYLMQGGLGLADRDQYFDATPQRQTQLQKYQAHIANVLQMAGYEHSAEKAKAIVALETSIAKVHMNADDSAKEENVDNHWSNADFSAKAPGLDWAAFFNAARLANRSDLVAYQPGAIKGEAALIQSVSLETWKDYLRFHVIDRYADVLPKVFMQPAAASQKSRRERAVTALNKALPDAVGQMYVASYFPPESKAKVQAILANVIEVWKQRIAGVQWMSVAARTQTLAKLNVMYFDVGYPTKWTDYSALSIDAADAYGNAQRVAEWNYMQALGQLGKTIDRTEWVIPVQAVGGVYIPLTNTYNMAAALLQGCKFDPTAPDAMNYGSIGAIMGHEISHFIDALGADTDVRGGTGKAHHWWSADDTQRFDANSQPLIDQFSSYRSFPDGVVNGKLTRDENMADLGGLTTALEAFHRSLGSKTSDKAFMRQQDRLFFIGWARSSRMRITDEDLRKQLATDTHAPQNFRVDTVRNIDAWYDAFDVAPGQRLYLEPGARVHVW